MENAGGEIVNSTIGNPTSCENEGDNWINFGTPSKLYATHDFVVKIPGFTNPAEADYPHYIKAFDYGIASSKLSFKKYAASGMYKCKIIVLILCHVFILYAPHELTISFLGCFLDKG